MIRRILFSISLGVSLCLALPAFSGEGSNILFIIDSSGSMWGQVDGVAKIETAKESLGNLLGDLPPDTQVGLMVYGHRSKDDCKDVEVLIPLGKNDPNAMKEKISHIQPKGKTPLTYSLNQSKELFASLQGQSNHIILVSDGKESCGGDPCEAAKKLAESGVGLKVHVVGFDVSNEEKKQLECIAKNGNGSYFNVKNTKGFKEAFVQVKQEVAKSKKPELKEFFFDDFEGEEFKGVWKVVNPNPDNMVLDDGKYLVIANTGKIFKETANNILVYNDEIPAREYVVAVKFATSMLQNSGWNQHYDYEYGSVSGVIFYLDKDNYLLFAPGRSHGSVFGRFFKRQGGKRDVELKHTISNPLKNPDTYMLKIEKIKYKYTAYIYNPDPKKEGWEKVGTLSSLKKLKPGLISFRGSGEEVTTEFDSFKIEIK